MLAIDISPSMKETDLKLNGDFVSRLDVVKNVVSTFVEQRKGDRIGLVLFGSEPYIQSPLSFDTKTVNTLLEEAYLGMAGKATAIGDAIGLGVKRLRERPKDSRVLILLSDGANTAGEIPPEKAAQLAAKENIVIYTIGIGADEVYRRSFFGTKKINPSADLDEDMLTAIAQLTEGKYFRARNTEELNAIYQLINELEPIELETKSYRPSKSLVFYFLGLSALCYLLAIIGTYSSKLPSVRSASKGEID
jgi:Ca-activated chloride channel family protein